MDWKKFEEVAKAITAADPSLVGSTIYIWGGQGFFSRTGRGLDRHSGRQDRQHRQRRQAAGDEKAAGRCRGDVSLVDMKVTKLHYSKQFYDGNVGMLLIGEWFPGRW